jgi:hypothetical protein
MNSRLIKLPEYTLPLVLIAVACILWVQSIASTSIDAISNFGLITALPITYFISMGCLTLSFLIALKKQAHPFLLAAQIFLLLIFLHFTPLIIEGARQRYAFEAYGVADYIVRTGALSPDIVTYNNWPSFQVLISTFITMGGLKPDLLVWLTSPGIIEIILFFPLYFFFNTVTTNTQQKWLGIWLFYLGDWIGRLYLSSQAFAFIFFVIILTLILQLFAYKIGNNKLSYRRRLLILLFLFYFILVSGHALSSLIPLSIILFLSVAYAINKKLLNKRLWLLFLSFAIIAFAWNIFFATSYFDSSFIDNISKIGDIQSIFQQNLTGAGGNIPQQFERILTNNVKIIFSAIFIIFAISGFLVERKRAENHLDKTMFVALVGIWLISAVLMYGGELFMRLWLFSLPIITYFAIKNLGSKKIFAVLCVFLIFFAPALHIWAVYGGENFDYIPQGELAGTSFLYSTVSHGYFVGGQPWRTFMNAPDLYKTIYFNFYASQDNLTSSLDYSMGRYRDWSKVNLTNLWPFYVLIDSGDKAFNSQKYNQSDLYVKIEDSLNQSPFYNAIYSNPEFKIYAYGPPTGLW